jgi:RHS repeat-associated protein
MHRTGKGVDRVCRTQRQWQSILLVSVVALVAAMPGIGAAGPRGKIADAPSARMDADRTSNDDGAVLRALLAGEDARSAVSDSLEKRDRDIPARPKGERRPSAFGNYAASLRQMAKALAGSRAAWSAKAKTASRNALDVALSNLQASRLLVDARIEQVERRVGAPSMPAVARQRWKEHRAGIEAALARIDAAAENLSRALGTPDVALDLSVDRMSDAVASETALSAAPTYGATLPLFRPRLASRNPELAPVVIPSYANALADTTPVAEDYGTSEDAPMSAPVLAQAEALGHDYTRILDFVRSQVRTQWYVGAQKGAETTLRTLAGNDTDQASLLIALLRASGAPARYVRGVLDVPVADLAAMLGVRGDDVGRALAAAGVPNRPIVIGGRIATFAIEHVYVSAWLPFSNYRGTSADLDGQAWIPLAPALKPHAFTPAAGALARLAMSANNFADQYLSTTQMLSPLDLLRQQVSDGLSHLSPPLAYASQLAHADIDAPPLELLPASLPVPVEVVTGEFARLPETLRQHAHIVVRAGDGADTPVVFDRVLPMARLLDHRVTISYQPASIDDGRIADGYGGLGGTPPYLVRLRPVLNIAGMPALAGEGELEGGAAHRIEITIDGPGGSAAASQQLIAGGIAALVFDAQGDEPPEQGEDVVLPGESESAAARLLANFGARYLASWDRANAELADLVGVSVVRPFPSVALVINQYRVDRINGAADALEWRGVALDAALRPVEPMAQTANAAAAVDWMTLAALQGSVLEHQLFEQQWAVDSVSADKGLALAREQGTPVLALTQATGISGVNQPQAVLDAISGWLARGYVVDVPRDPITYEDWSGAVWRVRSLPTGEAGYFIAGALAGGSTAMPPELWYFRDLAEWLSNPYGEEASEDPRSAVAISLDASAQLQDGVVDTEATKPLLAFLQDEQGHPVKGAIVHFVRMLGSGKLIGADSQPTDALTATTDVHGVARARFRFGQRQEGVGIYRVIPDQAHPQWVEIQTVDIFAESDVGDLRSGQPYTLYAWPGPPTTLLLDGPEAGSLTPALGYEQVSMRVTDRFDNSVANVAVDLSAATQYGPVTQCAWSNSVTPIDAALFEGEQCPRDQLRLTGNTCAMPTLSLLSQSPESQVYVVPPATGLATVTLAGTAAGHGASLQLSTGSLFEPCADPIDVVVAWSYVPGRGLLPQHGSNYFQPLDAAPPGGVVQLRSDYWRAVVVANSNYAGFDWQPIHNGYWAGFLTNGSLVGYHETVDAQSQPTGSYLLDVRAGPEAGAITGRIYAREGSLPVDHPGDGGSIHAWSVDLLAPTVAPNPIPLTPFGATDAPMHFKAMGAPAEYIGAPAALEFLQDDEVLVGCTAPLHGIASLECDVPRGVPIDSTKQYSLRTVFNDGTPFRLESVHTPVLFGSGIVAGYGMLPRAADAGSPSPPDGDPLSDELALVQGRYPTSISLDDSIDIPSGYSCASGARFGYVLARDATVSLNFYRLDSGGNPAGTATWAALDNVAVTHGLSDVQITSDHLPTGAYKYELKAVSADGSTETHVGRADHGTERRDALPLAHSFVKGVDVHSGGAVLSEEDIAVGGRGPGMKLTRTYASHQGNERTFFGRGWSSDLDAQVLVDDCGSRIVTGAAGQGQRFVRDPEDHDAADGYRYLATSGYHGTLIEVAGNYDFYAKDGTRYHFAQADTRGPRLSYIEDANRNRVGYIYELSQGAPRIKRVEDSAGRAIDLDYVVKHIERQSGGFTIKESLTVVSDARGPGGLQLHYDYDDNGNLSKTTRSDASHLGNRTRAYTYVDLGDVCNGDPGGGGIVCHRLGYRLKTTTNVPDAATRTYDYALGWSGIDTDHGVVYIPEQRVRTVVEPDVGVTTFDYPEVRGLGPVTTDITDARHKPNHYALNRYGAAEAVTDPAGTTTTEWDLQHLEPHVVTDALGTTTTWTYDAAGNRTAESIVHPTAGTITRSWTYKPQGEFDPPYLRNRVDVAIDARDHPTAYGYDDHGNLTSTTRGGVIERDGYDPNGDHSSHTDGLGHVWLWRYDTWGTLRNAEDPLHHVSAATFDERSRKLSGTDANGHRTSYTYDAQDRVLTTTYPSTESGTAVETAAYDDIHDTRTETNPNHHETVSSFDTMGRLVGVRRHDGSQRTLDYDKNGNLLHETDFANPPNATTHVYDDANRRTETHAPEGRTTLTTYDALGHVLSETIGEGDTAALDPRVTEYAYQHPLYKRTLVRRHLDAGTSVDEATDYDANGNPTKITDPLHRVIERHYDDRDRLHQEEAPLGKVTTTAYDNADRVISETLSGPGLADQVRKREYDDANRLTAAVDAESHRRSLAYDNTGNITSRSDARGKLTRMEYDARDRVTKEIGPAEGQVTTYRYDLAGNRTHEVWANGNDRTSTFDVLERHAVTTDSVGPVESYTYTANDDVETRTDANGHVTTNHYDGLRRLVQQDLPPIAGQARTLHKGYDVHGDVMSETDAGNHVTTHAYDALGRKTSTTLPPIAAEPDAVLGFGYDLVGNLTSQTDARGNTTTTVYDDLNRKTSQTDPATADAQGAPGTDNGRFTQHWTYDVAGNVLTHFDRRSIVTTTTYDRENRPLIVTRDGLTTSTRSYDEDGRLHTDTDALGRLTTNTYDDAGRRIKEERPLGFVQSWTYEPLGDVHSETDADGRTTTKTYTPRRLLDSETNHASETTTYGYDGEGHRTAMRRPLGEGHDWTYTYDEGDRLVAVTDPAGVATGSSTTFGYDLDGQLTRQTDTNGHTTTYAYDARHHRTGLLYPTTAEGTASGSWTWDPDGNIATHTTPNGKLITSTFDALSRPTSESVDTPLATEIATTTWHHDGNGNLTAIDETVNGTTRHATRHYDAFDRLDTDTDVHGKALVYVYDAVGNRTQLSSDGVTTLWGYNALNQNDAVTVPGQGTTAIAYFPSGKIHVLTRPDGSTSTTEYDTAGRTQSIVHAKAGSEIAHEAYAYDANSNRTEQREANGAVTSNGEETTTYIYDRADRLTDVTEPDPATSQPRHTTYALDPVGNRTEETIDVNGTPVSHSTLGYDERDRLTDRTDPVAGITVTQTWDADGNQTTQVANGQTRTFAYDARDRLMTLEQPNAPPLTFDYQSDGLRLKKTQGSQQTRYQYDQQSLLAETNSIGNPLSRYHYSATQLISRTEAGSTPTQRHYLNDALNTPIALLTQQGSVSARTKYDAWGELVTQQADNGIVTNNATDGATADLNRTDQQPIGYTGYLTDPESGLYYAKARYYDPRIARFTTEDPEEGQAMQPPSLHRYLYAYANPTVYVDPTGRVGFLTSLRDGFDQADQWLRDKAMRYPMFADRIGEVRGTASLLSLPVRTVNLASDAVAQALPAGGIFDDSHQQGSIEFGKTVDTVVPLVSAYAQDPEGTKLRIGKAIAGTAWDTGVAAFKGDGGAVSDIYSAATQVAAPVAAEATLPRLLGSSAKAFTVAEDTVAADGAALRRIAANNVDGAAATSVTGFRVTLEGKAAGGRGLGANAGVDRIAGEYVGALQQANRILQTGRAPTTPWERIFRDYIARGEPPPDYVRGNALQQIADRLIERNRYARDAKISVNRQSYVDALKPLRPDVQIPITPASQGVIDITTPKQAPKIRKYDDPANKALINLLYEQQ